MDKYFVCLANSYKRGGRCVAGVEVVHDDELPEGWGVVWNYDGSPCWIRPVVDTQFGQIPNEMARGIRLMSVVKLTDVVPCPDGVHTEDVTFGTMQCLDQQVTNLSQFADVVHRVIFENNGHAVPEQQPPFVDYSLMMIRLDRAQTFLDQSREKGKVRMRFYYHGVQCEFPVTDPEFLAKFYNQAQQDIILHNVFLTLSLGMGFEGWHHKLVAAVMTGDNVAAKPQLADSEQPYIERQKMLRHNTYTRWNDEETPAIDSQEALLDEYDRLLAIKEDVEAQIQMLRIHIMQSMEKAHVERIDSDEFSVTYTAPRTVMQFDRAAFKQAHNELFEQYCKPQRRDAMLVIRRNKKTERL